MNASMKIKILRNRTGMVSGVVIPTEDLHEVKESIKQGTEFYKVISDLLMDQPNAPETEIILSHGKTVVESETDALVLTRALYADAFRKGVPMFYRDKRVHDSNEFARANPDGSEDLVSFDALTRSYTLIRNLAPAGKGFWADLISA